MPATAVSKQQALEELRREENDCSRCALRKGRTHCVFGTGDPAARLMLVGEAPGAEEDRTGRPFVGRAGKLLDRSLDDAGLARGEAYVTNVLKCRPLRDPAHPSRAGNDRPPTKTEIRACLPVLERQIAIIGPEVVCTLGKTPVQALLGTGEGVTALHGKVVEYRGSRLVPTFHPAAVFHNPRLRDAIIKDLETVKKLLSK